MHPPSSFPRAVISVMTVVRWQIYTWVIRHGKVPPSSLGCGCTGWTPHPEAQPDVLRALALPHLPSERSVCILENNCSHCGCAILEE